MRASARIPSGSTRTVRRPGRGDADVAGHVAAIAETAQRVAVMYGAQIVEEAPVTELFKEPLHPYTQGLLRSIPRIDLAATRKQKLEAIPGTVPTLRGDVKPGCRFAPRCAFAKPVCTEATPPLKEIRTGHKVACVLY